MLTLIMVVPCGYLIFATAVVDAQMDAQMDLTLGFKRTTLGLMVGGFTVFGGLSGRGVALLVNRFGARAMLAVFSLHCRLLAADDRHQQALAARPAVLAVIARCARYHNVVANLRGSLVRPAPRSSTRRGHAGLRARWQHIFAAGGDDRRR
jgi:hypothetical protein